VLRIAALDSSRVPNAPVLVAEVDGEVRAVVSIEDGAAIADPFYPTRDVVELLRMHAERSRRFSGPGLLRRLTLRPRSAL
jgi:hypothetical protein